MGDPLMRDDPWGMPERGRRRGQPSTGPTGGDFAVVPPGTAEPPPQRIIHDVPPAWDGKDPDNQVEPYLMLLSGWLISYYPHYEDTAGHDNPSLRAW